MVDDPGDWLSARIQYWVGEVDHCVDLDDDDPGWDDTTAVYDLTGAIDNRLSIDEDLATLPPEVRQPVSKWLADGPDGKFLRLTEPDLDQLLVRAWVVDEPFGKPWDSRVPLSRRLRAALEREAASFNRSRNDPPTEPDAAI